MCQGQSSREKFSGEQLSRGNHPGENLPGGQYVGGNISGGNFAGGNFPGGNLLRGMGASFRGNFTGEAWAVVGTRKIAPWKMSTQKIGLRSIVLQKIGPRKITPSNKIATSTIRSLGHGQPSGG